MGKKMVENPQPPTSRPPGPPPPPPPAPPVAKIEVTFNGGKIREMVQHILDDGVEMFVVGKVASEKRFREWELVGVFSNIEDAVKVCRTKNHFVGPVTLNKDIGDERKTWPGVKYPKRMEEAK